MTEPAIPQSATVLNGQTSTKTKHVWKIPLASPVIDAEMKAAALAALDEKLVMGESVFKFEQEFARYCGTKYAVSTNSGTAAISITLQSLGIGHGSEVVTTPFSFIATANGVIHAGAEPIFADVEDQGINLSAEKSKARITSKTRAVMPVHLYGHPAEMDKFIDLSKENGVKLVEDACQAHGAIFNGKRVGCIGDAGCFSFYPAKNMTVGGDGGMITTNNEDLVLAAESIRDCGRIRGSKYHMGRIGFTARLNSINAAIGRVQLRHLDRWNEARRRLASRYRKELEGIKGIKLPPAERDGSIAVYHLFVIRSDHRDRLRNSLEEKGIETGVHYPIPIHLQVPYRDSHRLAKRTMPLSEALSNEVLSLPLHPMLSEHEVVTISQLIKDSSSKT